MSRYKLIPTRISDPESYLVIAVNQGFKFNCNICEETGDQQLLCFCKKCERYMHPSCAGVETGFAYMNNGTKEPVLFGSEKLPRSCCKCLREMKEEDQLCLQQISRLDRKQQFPPTSDVRRSESPPLHSNTSCVHTHQIKNSHSVLGPSSSSITRHKSGHELHPKDNGTIYCCSGCKMESFGPHYACRNASCSFLLHAECMSPRISTRHVTS